MLSMMSVVVASGTLSLSSYKSVATPKRQSDITLIFGSVQLSSKDSFGWSEKESSNRWLPLQVIHWKHICLGLQNIIWTSSVHS
ncbi:hypothetical protein QYF36_014795 [Acer negundo]|nr:hypothetical protein QYF36_014795 [Acer negundo]